jgi:hypothetical protein
MKDRHNAEQNLNREPDSPDSMSAVTAHLHLRRYPQPQWRGPSLELVAFEAGPVGLSAILFSARRPVRILGLHGKARHSRLATLRPKVVVTSSERRLEQVL